MALPAIETFAQADGALNANWTTVNGALEVIGGQVTGNAAAESFAYWNADVFPEDQYAELEITALGAGTDYIGVCCRASSPGASFNGVLFRVQSPGTVTGLQIWQAGVRTFNPSGEHPVGGWAVGDVMRLEVEGNDIRLLRNGVVYATYSSPTGGIPAGGSAGLASFRVDNTAFGDNWRGDAIGAVSDPPPSITNVDTDDTITSTQAGVVLTGTDIDAATFEIRQGTTTVGQTINSQNATTVNFDVVFDAGVGPHLKHGDATGALINGDDQEDTHPITIDAPSGELYVDIGTPDTTSAERITASGDIASGDQLHARGEGGGAVPTGLTLVTDGTYYFTEGNTPAPFDVRAWDVSDSTWGDWATQAVTITGALAVGESADTAAVSGVVTVSGSLNVTEAQDTAAISGDANVTGDLASTEAPDTAAISGVVSVTGALTSTEAPDSAAISGVVTVSGSISVTEAPDVAAISGGANVNGALTATESPDLAVVSGDVLIAGSMAVSEPADAAAVAGTVSIEGTLSVTETPDSFIAFEGDEIVGTLTATEAADEAAIAGESRIEGDAVLSEVADTAAVAGVVSVTGTMSVSEQQDAAAVDGVVTEGQHLTAVETPDSASIQGVVTISGTMTVSEASDNADFNGSVEQLPVIGAIPRPSLAYATREAVMFGTRRTVEQRTVTTPEGTASVTFLNTLDE